MHTENWELLDVIYGDLQSELLRGLLEAQDIPVILSQEGAGHNVYPVLVGPLARVEILVPVSDLSQAKEVLKKYHAGEYEGENFPNEKIQGTNPENDLDETS
jgi:hypothetical protein